MCVVPERKKTCACDFKKTTSARDITSVVGGLLLAGTVGCAAGCVPWVRKVFEGSAVLYSVELSEASFVPCEGSSTRNHVNSACLTFSFSTSKLKTLRMTPPRD